jgi:DnaJ-class molecular chaperone
VPRSASDHEIKKAYRKLAMKPPDRNKDRKDAEAQGSERSLRSALGQENAAYDRFGHGIDP